MHESIEAITRASVLLRALTQKEKPSIPAQLGKYTLSPSGGKKPRIVIGNHPTVHALEMGQVGGKPVVTVLVNSLVIPKECFGNSIMSYASVSGGGAMPTGIEELKLRHRSTDNEMDRVVKGEQKEATVDKIHFDTKFTDGDVTVEHNGGRVFKVRGEGPNVRISPKNEGEHLRLTPTDQDSLTELLQLHERGSRRPRHNAMA